MEKFFYTIYMYGFRFQVSGVGLTALSGSLLRRRFLFCGMTTILGNSYFGGMTIARRGEEGLLAGRGVSARFASQWDGYLEFHTS